MNAEGGHEEVEQENARTGGARQKDKKRGEARHPVPGTGTRHRKPVPNREHRHRHPTPGSCTRQAALVSRQRHGSDAVRHPPGAIWPAATRHPGRAVCWHPGARAGTGDPGHSPGTWAPSTRPKKQYHEQHRSSTTSSPSTKTTCSTSVNGCSSTWRCTHYTTSKRAAPRQTTNKKEQEQHAWAPPVNKNMDRKKRKTRPRGAENRSPNFDFQKKN